MANRYTDDYRAAAVERVRQRMAADPALSLRRACKAEAAASGGTLSPDTLRRWMREHGATIEWADSERVQRMRAVSAARSHYSREARRAQRQRLYDRVEAELDRIEREQREAAEGTVLAGVIEAKTADGQHLTIRTQRVDYSGALRNLATTAAILQDKAAADADSDSLPGGAEMPPLDVQVRETEALLAEWRKHGVVDLERHRQQRAEQ